MISASQRRDTPAPHAGDPEGESLRARLRRYALAWAIGAAVVVAPAWPSSAHLRNARPPAFERALRWRDIIRMRLAPWLLMEDAGRKEPGQPPTI